ncbi:MULTISPECIES: hypothetical protein [unclassified Rathayibacter]|uniref:hypothetical protein n=1 Tax=unclassified Rathayibacter TaxID=2609250 RepID=UPI0012E80CBE|nr:MULTISPECIES: hypothetical protein [unclassified Rathayibacter]
MIAAQARNMLGRRRVTAPGGPVVSLTTYGRRTILVHLAIESIARGTQRPGRLILWLDEDNSLARPTPGLRRLRARGLEIERTPDLGPHKKYFPYAMSIEDHRLPLVTADDDTLYPTRWLLELTAAHEEHPDAVIAHRAHRVVVGEGTLAPYREWRSADPGTLSLRNFAVGVGGVLYPPAFLSVLRARGDAFTAVAPFADDVWLHSTAVRDRRPVLRIDALAESEFLPVRGSRTKGLFSANVDSGGNDRQIAATYSAEDLQALTAAIDRPVPPVHVRR